MRSIDDIREINQNFINEGQDEKYDLIKQILEDDNCFFKIDVDVAVDILMSLGFTKPLQVYAELVDPSNYREEKKYVVGD